MTPRERLIQEVEQAPDVLVDVLLKLLLLVKSGQTQILKRLQQFATTQPSELNQAISALELAGDLAGCVDGPPDLSTNSEYMKGFGA